MTDGDATRIDQRLDRINDTIRENSQRTHERIDELSQQMGRQAESISRLNARCEPCYRSVMGNGDKPLAVKVAELQERDRTRERLRDLTLARLSLIVGVTGIVSGLMGGVVGLAARWALGIHG